MTDERAESFDFLSLLEKEAAVPRKPSALPRILLSGVRLVRQASGRLLLVTTGLALGQAVLLAAQIVFAKLALQQLVRLDGGSRGTKTVVLPLVGLAAVTAVSGIASAVQTQRLRLLSERTTMLVQSRVMAACSAVDLLEFESPAFYDRLQRIEANSLSRPIVVTQALLTLLAGVLSSVTLGVAVLALFPLLMPILVLAGVPLILLSRRASRSEFAFQVKQSESYRERYYLQTLLTGRPAAKEVRAFDLSAPLTERWTLSFRGYLDGLGAQVRYRERLGVASAAISGLSGASALALLVVLLNQHRISLASAGAAAVASRLLAGRLAGLVSSGGQLYESSLFLKDFEDFTVAAVPVGPTDGLVPPPFQVLRASDLSFTYPRASKAALTAVDVEIRRGEVIALVGENGSGKTTLAKVLAGLYGPTSGQVEWDGVNLASLDIRQVREQTAVIFQDFVQYQLPAQQNIGLGRAAALDDLEGIEAAARQAGAHGFLSHLPKGYDTYLSSAFRSGQDLSLGQWQRVALARAFYREAPFVILDEPSSALDPRAEHELFSRLREFLAGRTVLFISHRFSSVRTADRIYVLHEGRVVEQGKHDDLMARDGLYKELFTLQAAAYLSDDVP